MIAAKLHDSESGTAAKPHPHRDSAEVDPVSVVESFQNSRNTAPLDGRVDEIASAQRGPVTTPPCPVCGECAANPQYNLEGGDFSLVACVNCGLGRLYPPPEPQRIPDFYPPEYYGAGAEKFETSIEFAVRRIAAWQARKLTRGLPRGARVLDVGCGRGTLLKALSAQGFEAHGFDISQTPLEGIGAEITLHCADSLRSAELPDACFDLVVIWHVLEHLPDPRETLLEIRRLLKPGGRIAVAVPNFSSWQAKWAGPAWFHLDLPRHLFHFSANNLRRLLTEAGFELEAERHFSLRQNPFGWVQSALNRWNPCHRNGLYSSLKRRPPMEPEQPGIVRRRRLERFAYWIGMPIGLTLACFAAMCRRGATVCLLARSSDGKQTSSPEVLDADLVTLERFAARHPECFPDDAESAQCRELEITSPE